MRRKFGRQTKFLGALLIAVFTSSTAFAAPDMGEYPDGETPPPPGPQPNRKALLATACIESTDVALSQTLPCQAETNLNAAELVVYESGVDQHGFDDSALPEEGSTHGTFE